MCESRGAVKGELMLDEKIEELEKLLTKLESDGVSVEEGIALFENGIALTKDCLRELNATKGKITQLKKEMDKLIEQPLAFEDK